PADGGALPVGPPGRRAPGLPGDPRTARRRARDRAEPRPPRAAAVDSQPGRIARALRAGAASTGGGGRRRARRADDRAAAGSGRDGCAPHGRGRGASFWAGIAVGAGSVWVTNSGSGTVSRVSPETEVVLRTVRVGNGPIGVAVAGGSVWVSNSL